MAFFAVIAVLLACAAAEDQLLRREQAKVVNAQGEAVDADSESFVLMDVDSEEEQGHEISLSTDLEVDEHEWMEDTHDHDVHHKEVQRHQEVPPQAPAQVRQAPPQAPAQVRQAPPQVPPQAHPQVPPQAHPQVPPQGHPQGHPQVPPQVPQEDEETQLIHVIQEQKAISKEAARKAGEAAKKLANLEIQEAAHAVR